MQANLSHFLVTGANGFIGLRLCSELRKLNCRVTAVLKTPQDGPWDQVIIHDFSSNYNFINNLSELANKNIITSDIEGIIHLANIAHTDANISWEKYFKVNVLSTVDLLDFAKLANIKAFLYLSSVQAVHDASSDAWPNHPYGITKRISEYILSTNTNSGLQISILRPSLVYGPGVKGNLKLLTKLAQKKLLPSLPETNNQRSMVHVDDLIQAILLSINNPKAHKQIFVLADNFKYSTKQIFEIIKANTTNTFLSKLISKLTIPYWLLNITAKFFDVLQIIFQKKLFFNSMVLEKLFSSSYFDATKIKNLLNWQPKHSFSCEEINRN